MDMANLMARSYLVMTDSGGLQEEAPALAKPVLVLRDLTERPEAVQAGLARIVGTSRQAIVGAATDLLTNISSYSAMAQGKSPYGDGRAAERIVDAIEYVNGLRASKPTPFVSRLVTPTTGDQMLYERPLGDELFYEQLDERIKRARAERQIVSVVTIDMEKTDREHFAEAVRAITRGLRKSDTAAALEGKRLVLVLSGAGKEQAEHTTARLLKNLDGPLRGRRQEDRLTPDSPDDEHVHAIGVHITTYEDHETVTETIPAADRKSEATSRAK